MKCLWCGEGSFCVDVDVSKQILLHMQEQVALLKTRTDALFSVKTVLVDDLGFVYYSALSKEELTAKDNLYDFISDLKEELQIVDISHSPDADFITQNRSLYCQLKVSYGMFCHVLWEDNT